MRPYHPNEPYALLCGFLASPTSPEMLTRLSHCSREDWQALLQWAISQRVISIVYYYLKDQDNRFNIPEDVRQAMRQAHLQQAGRQVALFHELTKILETLHQANIPVVLLKGIDLAYTLYPDPSLRPIGDLDLLIPYECVDEAIARILPMDYRLEFSWSMPEICKGHTEHFYTEANLDKQSAPFAHVELHWRLVTGHASRYAADPEWFWQGTRPTVFNNIPCLSLKPDRNLLYLAGHAAIKHVLFKHGQGQVSLLWFYDMHLLLSQKTKTLDWDELLAAGHRFGWNTALYLALQETQARFGTPLPQEMMDRLQTNLNQHEIKIWNGEVKRVRTRSNDSIGDFRFLKPRMKYRLIWALIFPSKNYMIYRYQPKIPQLWPLYYLYRWYDIATDLLGSIRKRMLNAEC